MTSARRAWGEHGLALLMLVTLCVSIFDVSHHLKTSDSSSSTSTSTSTSMHERVDGKNNSESIDDLTAAMSDITLRRSSNESKLGAEQDQHKQERSEDHHHVNNDDDDGDDKEKKLIEFIVDAWEKKYTIRGSSSLSESENKTRGSSGDDHVHSSYNGDADANRSRSDMDSFPKEEMELIEKVLRSSPPHLSDCDNEEEQLHQFDRRNGNGSLPDWALGGSINGYDSHPNQQRHQQQQRRQQEEDGPFPPWIQGSDADNLPLTRVVQRDIWVHQHPVNCSDPRVRFAVGTWWGMWHGVGSQLHGMTALLGQAMKAGRVLVPLNNYVRANQPNCRRNTRKRLACYFAAMTSPQCYTRALVLLREQERNKTTAVEGSNPPMVVRWGDDQTSKSRTSVPLIWGTGDQAPWRKTPASIVMNGRLIADGITGWWRAQALRYILRWPTKYMCGVTNRVRNRAFGSLVAVEMTRSIRRLGDTSLYYIDARGEGGSHIRRIDSPGEAALLRATGLRATWQRRAGVKGGGSLFVPRPLMSVHVRLGSQKMKEMSLFGLATYMRIAESVRLLDGGVKNVWLSTEVESVIEQSKEYTGWKFFYSKLKRMDENQPDFVNELGQKGTTLTPSFPVVENAFANLLISAEADYFIGALGSNWCRLIDELRKTNGRASSRYITVNNNTRW